MRTTLSQFAAAAVLALACAQVACGGEHAPRTEEAHARAQASAPAAPASAVPPRQFVQEFYDWYVPFAAWQTEGPAWSGMPAAREQAISPELLAALKKDAAAGADAEEIVGLDYDPFLNAQDPCERYEAGPATPSGAGYRVEVFGVCGGERHPTADVVAELQPRGRTWVFTNFRDPAHDGGDLRSMLRRLEQDRRSGPDSAGEPAASSTGGGPTR